MRLVVLYTPLAHETLNLMWNSIANKFGERVANEFKAKAAKAINLIAIQPFMFKASPVDENVRVAFIASQCSLYYRVTKTEIHLICFWDNRQDPIFL